MYNDIINRIDRGAMLSLAAALLLGLANPGLTQAQEGVRDDTAARDTVRLTFEEALRRGFATGEEVLSAEARIDEASAGITSARSAMLPQIGGNLTYQRALASSLGGAGDFLSLPDSLSTFDPDTTASIEDRLRFLERRAPTAPLTLLGSSLSGIPFGQANTYNAGLSLSQTLFTGGRIRGSVRQAEAVTGAARAQLQAAEADLLFGIGQSYLDALLAGRRIEIALATVEQIEAQLDQVRLENRAGNAAELDVLRVEVELANADPEVVAAQNALDAAELDLKRLINVPANQPIRLEGELNSADFQPVSDEVLDQYLGVGIVDRRPDVRAAEQQVESRRAGVDIAKSAFWPDVTISGSLSGQAFPQDFLPSRSDFQFDAAVGFSVQLPIFQGFRRKGDLDAARAVERQAEFELISRRQSAEVEIAQLRAELRRTQALIAARAEAVRQAERVHQLTELSYQEGVDTFLQLNDARLALQEARLNEAQAVHDYYLAFSRLLRAAGEPPRSQLAQAQNLLQLPQGGGAIDQ